jgi:hypothetical protein
VLERSPDKGIGRREEPTAVLVSVGGGRVLGGRQRFVEPRAPLANFWEVAAAEVRPPKQALHFAAGRWCQCAELFFHVGGPLVGGGTMFEEGFAILALDKGRQDGQIERLVHAPPRKPSSNASV